MSNNFKQQAKTLYIGGKFGRIERIQYFIIKEKVK